MFKKPIDFLKLFYSYERRINFDVTLFCIRIFGNLVGFLNFVPKLFVEIQYVQQFMIRRRRN